MLNKNPCFAAIPDVKAICDEYFGDLNLHFFGHITVAPDGQHHFLNSRHEWPEYGVQEEQPPAGFLIYNEIANSIVLPHLNSGKALGWTDELMAISRERFGIENLMGIFRKYDDHYQAFFFDVHQNNAYEHYLNNLDFYENFIFYYRDKAKKLLKNAATNPFHVQEKYLQEKNQLANESKSFNQSEALVPDQYHLRHQGKFISISRREYECLHDLAHGRKIKEIGRALNISPRTVDTYIVNLKNKLSINNLSEAIQIYWNNRIMKFASSNAEK